MSKIYIIIFLIASALIHSCNIACKTNKNQYDVELQLWRGIDHGNLQATKEAVAKGANINLFSNRVFCERTEHNRRVSSPLLQALSKGRYEIAEYLIDSGANVNYIDSQGESVLQYCAEFYPKIIEKVIVAGADIEYADKENRSALDYATMYDVDNAPKHAFDVLIEHGAKPKKKTIELLLSKLTPEKYGMLKTAIELTDNTSVDASIVSAFALGGKGNISIDKDKDIILGGISAFGSWDMLKPYLKDENAESIGQLLKAAVLYDNKDVAFNLLNSYNDIHLNDNSAYKYGDFLYYATFNDDVELVDKVYQRLGGNAPLALSNAILKSNFNVIKYFLNIGIDPNSRVLEGNLLESCCFHNKYDAAQLLLKYGAVADSDSLTKACVNGYIEIAKLLLEYGADANAKNYYPDGSGGYSVLLQTIRAGQFECVKLLIDYGADIYYEYNGKNAIDYAKSSGAITIYEYLLSKKKQTGRENRPLVCISLTSQRP